MILFWVSQCRSQEITKDPQQAIRKIYNQLGMELTDDMERFLSQSTGFTNTHKTKGKYSPEEYGLTREMISTRFNYVYRDYPELKA